MQSFRFKSSERILSARVIRIMRRFTTLGIRELKARAASGQPLLEFPILDNNWQESQRIIKRLLALIEGGELPLDIAEYNEGCIPEEEALSPDGLESRLQMVREIKLQIDMETQLRLGEIGSREEYEPDDEDEV